MQKVINSGWFIIFLALIFIGGYYLLAKKSKGPAPVVQNEIKEILGHKDDLVSFSILPGEKVSGIRRVTGTVKGGYFFEGNILLDLLDSNQNRTSYGPGHAQATTDWMTAGPVSFEADYDFSLMPKGPAYIEIHNDNPSGIREYDKSILIPVVIE